MRLDSMQLKLDVTSRTGERPKNFNIPACDLIGWEIFFLKPQLHDRTMKVTFTIHGKTCTDSASM